MQIFQEEYHPLLHLQILSPQNKIQNNLKINHNQLWQFCQVADEI